MSNTADPIHTAQDSYATVSLDTYPDARLLVQQRLEPCSEGAEFLDGKDPFEAWNTCQRPNWMLWLLEALDLGDEMLRRQLAADFAEAALKYVPEGEDRPRQTLLVVRLFIAGGASVAELSAARSAAWSAAWSAARSAAWNAARSAAWSAAESAARSAAESAARSAAESAAWSAAESAAWNAARSAAESAARSAARSAAWSAAESAQADLIRARIPASAVLAALLARS